LHNFDAHSLEWTFDFEIDMIEHRVRNDFNNKIGNGSLRRLAHIQCGFKYQIAIGIVMLILF
jgi:methionyl-tRNA synthetase